MRAQINRWHAAICDQLRKSISPLSPDQIWDAMKAAGFQHKSTHPRSTLGARLAELVAQGEVRRVGPAQYQIIDQAALIEERAS